MSRKRCLGCGTMRGSMTGEHCSTCSDYEAVIAELEAELANIKTEFKCFIDGVLLDSRCSCGESASHGFHSPSCIVMLRDKIPSWYELED